MKRILVCFLILLAVCSVSASLVPGAHSQPSNIKILTTSYYIDSNGFLNVVGEVQNIGTNTVDPVFLTGTATATDGETADSYSKVLVLDLVSQQKAPFNMVFTPLPNMNGWYYDMVANINLNVYIANATSNYQYPDLTVTSSSGSIGTSGDFSGAYVVNGVIKNTGTQAASNLTVVGTFYNSTGAVVAIGWTNYLTPRTLDSNGATSFQLAAFDINQTGVVNSMKITSYSLLVQSEAPILSGTAPPAPTVTGTSSGNQNPNPTNTQSGTNPTSGDDSNDSGSNSPSDNTLIYAGIAIVVIVAVVAALVFLRKRSHT
jgi:hypothetical protein